MPPFLLTSCSHHIDAPATDVPDVVVALPALAVLNVASILLATTADCDVLGAASPPPAGFSAFFCRLAVGSVSEDAGIVLEDIRSSCSVLVRGGEDNDNEPVLQLLAQTFELRERLLERATYFQQE